MAEENSKAFKQNLTFLVCARRQDSGPIDDYDDTLFNGERVGRTDNKTPDTWRRPRVYVLPGRLVKPGRRVIAARVYDQGYKGGMYGTPEELMLSLKQSVLGDWHHPDYRTVFKTSDDPYRYFRW